MTTHEPIPVVRGTAQLLAVLPHLFGYHLDHCLALLATRHTPGPGGVSRGAVAFSIRMDLPPSTEPGLVPDLAPLVDSLVPRLRQAVRDEPEPLLLHVFCYDPPEEADGQVGQELQERLCATLARLAGRTGLVLHDVVLVRDGGRSHRTVVAATEPADGGWEVTPAAADVPAAADLVLAGRAPLPSRGDVVEAVRRRDEVASDATDLALSMLALQPERLDDGEALRVLGAWVVDGGIPPTARQRAWMAVVLQDRTVRDAVLARWLPESFSLHEVLPADQVDAFATWVPPLPAGQGAVAGPLGRLLELAGQVPVPLSPPLLTIAGCLAWERGEGTVATEACALALQVDPDYRMAALLWQILEGGVRPPLRPRAPESLPARRGRRRRGKGRAA